VAVAQRLPRFYARIERIHDMQRVAKIILEAEDDDGQPQPGNGNGGGRQAAGSTPAGAEARLRGIPAIGRGVTGAIRGTVPHLDGLG
jgi:hypothetical protein